MLHKIAVEFNKSNSSRTNNRQQSIHYSFENTISSHSPNHSMSQDDGNNDNNKNQSKAHLHWAKNNTQPCFCNSTIYLDIKKLSASPEQLAAIFGISSPSLLSLQHQQENGTTEPIVLAESKEDGPCWDLKPGQHYNVHLNTDASCKIIPVNHIFSLLPGDTEEEKSERLEKLSNNFYRKIWEDSKVPEDFRAKFHSRSSTAKIQAFRQFDWLIEVFGGPSFRDKETVDTTLLRKVMAKHTSSRMTKNYAIAWLELMKESVEEEFPNMVELQTTMGLYWLHFFAWFPYTDEERREFRQLTQVTENN